MDRQNIIEDAKAELFMEGTFAPLLVIEWENGQVDRHRFEEFPGESFANKKALFAVGREYGRKRRRTTARELCFINEMWFHSWNENGPEPDILPSENPDRQEALVMLWLTVTPEQSFSQEVRVYEMIRGEGTLDLLLHETDVGSVQSKLLISALAGISTARLSDQAFSVLVARYAKG